MVPGTIRYTGSWERSSVSVGARSDVQEPARFLQGEFVPDASWHHDGVAGSQFDDDVAVGAFEPEGQGTVEEVEELVAIGVDLTVMGCVRDDQR